MLNLGYYKIKTSFICRLYKRRMFIWYSCQRLWLVECWWRQSPAPAAVVSTVTALSWWGDAEQSRRDVGGSWLWQQHGHRAVIMIIRTSDILGDDIEVAIKVINNILIQCVWTVSCLPSTGQLLKVNKEITILFSPADLTSYSHEPLIYSQTIKI